MNTSLKSILTAVTLAAAALLTGCATPDLKASFTKGEEVLYGRVANVWNQAIEPKETLCGSKYPKYKEYMYAPDFDIWAKQTGFCDAGNLDKLQQVQIGIGVVDANGGRVNLGAFPPKGLSVSEGDIVAVKVYPSSDGRFRRPAEILRVAAKAKDATKKNGCYWDAGTGVWSGFNQGGAVCEGWHWKDHPFSNPDLLKQ